jgi:hypothetical protein
MESCDDEGEFSFWFTDEEVQAIATPQPEQESAHDFDRGFGIGGLGRHVEDPIVPTVAQMERLEQVQSRYVKCDCGHSVAPALVMSASMGSSCPGCYDRMDDGF